LKQIKKFIKRNWRFSLILILLLNFTLRLLIYYQSILFSFSDYSVYLSGVDIIHNKGIIKLVEGNFLFTISYLGFYAKYLFGNISYFYILNCFLGTLITFLISKLIIRLSGIVISGFITAFILTFYTEFMVFSSVFYSPIIMLFLLSLLIWLLYYYFRKYSLTDSKLNIVLLLIVFLITFLFKPELIFLPIFLILFSLFFIKKDTVFFKRTIYLAFVLIFGTTIFLFTGIYSKPKDQVIANDFIFFGHTNYGGDGGEGSFVYQENEVRYNKALSEWCLKNNITQPGTIEINRFQQNEVIKYITHSPFSWIKLQLTKFFRTFGVVPETTSFKVLYTGLFKGNLWLTSIVVVTPIALILLLFILFFDMSSLKKLFNLSLPEPFILVQPNNPHSHPPKENNKHFVYIYYLLLLYYIVATIFFGQYQERYRLPLMVVYIIPLLSYFIASFNIKQFLHRTTLIVKCAIIVLFITIWTFQAKKAISNKDRLRNALESIILPTTNN
jgi:hypothetical protein